MRSKQRTLFAALALAGAAAVAPGSAAYAGKPAVISVAAQKPGSNIHAEITAIADAVSKKFGTKIRVLPLGNAMGRAIALRSGKAKIWMSCSAYYTAFEGIGDFATEKWGPQDIRILNLVNRKANFSFATPKDSPVNSVADMKGKRVAWVVGNSGIDMQIKAYLAYGGLTLGDVKLVKFPGYVASLRGLIAGQADVVMAANSSSATQEIAASPGGLKWIPMPRANKAAWAKVQRLAPFVAPLTITSGPGVEKGQSVQVGSYPCPTLVTYAGKNDNDAYWLTKMVVETWSTYKDAVKTGPYWQVDTALKSRFAVPYHKGAIKYYKEIGKWTPEMEAHQKMLLKRIKVLKAAFAKAKKSYKGDAKEFGTYWEKQKKAALNAAGF